MSAKDRLAKLQSEQNELNAKIEATHAEAARITSRVELIQSEIAETEALADTAKQKLVKAVAEGLGQKKIDACGEEMRELLRKADDIVYRKHEVEALLREFDEIHKRAIPWGARLMELTGAEKEISAHRVNELRQELETKYAKKAKEWAALAAEGYALGLLAFSLSENQLADPPLVTTLNLDVVGIPGAVMQVNVEGILPEHRKSVAERMRSEGFKGFDLAA